MEIAFTRADLDTWARFSGDYNPIHFNDDHVRQFGMDGVVVHGMLAMLELKRRLPRDNWRGPWVEWRAMLKRAMPLSSSYSITEKIREGGSRQFHFVDSGSGARSITGTCADVALDVSTLPASPQYTIDTEKVAAKLARFSEDYGPDSGYWTFLDALVFAEYLDAHSGTMFAAELEQMIGEPPRSAGDAPNFMAMHTHHTVTSSLSMMRRELPAQPHRIQYEVVKKERVDAAGAVYVLMDIPVWVNGTLEMVVEVGLMARTLERHNAETEGGAK